MHIFNCTLKLLCNICTFILLFLFSDFYLVSLINYLPSSIFQLRYTIFKLLSTMSYLMSSDLCILLQHFLSIIYYVLSGRSINLLPFVFYLLPIIFYVLFSSSILYQLLSYPTSTSLFILIFYLVNLRLHLHRSSLYLHFSSHKLLAT